MFWSELETAVRGLKRTPWLSAAAVVALALGIGPNTAIFSTVYATVLGALPAGSVGVDLDEARLLLARANAQVLGRNVTLVRADVTALRETMDKLKDKLKTAAIVLASVADGKVTLIAGVTADATSKVKAGELVNFVAQQVGGKGGGRPDMAQAGGTDPSGLPAALAGVAAWVGERA